MRVLIIGATGFLGKSLVEDFSVHNEVFAADKYENVRGTHYIDLTKKGLVEETFSRLKPELVLLPASITGVDYCQRNQDAAWRVNTEGPKDVAVAAKKHGAFMVFYSTDYVFDGGNGPYTEEDRTGPINFYGKTKLEAERIIQKEIRRFLIIRTCSLYGWEKGGFNYAMQVLNASEDRRIIRAVNDQFGTPTYVKNLSGITLKLISDGKEGLFHAAGPDYLNRAEFAREIASVFCLDKGLIVETATDQLGQPAARPKKGGLKTDKLEAEAALKTMCVREGLLAMKTMRGR